MSLMRFTIVDSAGSVSFILLEEALPALLAACARNPATVNELLDRGDRYYSGLADHVRNGLAVFDEHNTAANPAKIHEAFRYFKPHEQPPFRVIDEATREESLRPVHAGVVIFNLIAQRIVQLQNTSQTIERRGRGRVFEGDRPTGRTFVYQLPKSWALVP
jgi:hypothetical protein